VIAGHLRDEEIQDALDGRLDHDTVARYQAHARSCEACDGRWQAFERVKRAAAQLAAPELPAALGEDLASALDAEDRRARDTRRQNRRLVLAAGVTGLVALAGAGTWMATRPQVVTVATKLPAQAAQDFRDIRSGRQRVVLPTADPSVLEAHLAAQGLGFHARVFDLAMMKQHLLGGGVAPVGGRRAARFAYRGEDGSLVVCHMYLGILAELPEPRHRREHDGIPFQIYEAGELTLVFWPEGEVVCVLVGDGPPEAVIALALAKAIKAGVKA
jgi:anti-sigma factor RsiW